jgi:hypothetical protein
LEADELSQHLCQQPEQPGWGGIGMRLAGVVADFDVAVGHFTVNRHEASRVSQIRLFTGLDRVDRKVLSDWLQRAEVRGIDTAIDLSVRPWNIAGIPVIVGIFEKNRSQATWLIIHCIDGWVLARCGDGSVSDVSGALSDILALIGDGPGA